MYNILNNNNSNNRNYVDGQICYHLYRKLAELLPKNLAFLLNNSEKDNNAYEQR